MDKQFDELSKSLAEGVSRREALRKFGFGLAGVLLAAVGLRSKAGANPGCFHNGHHCTRDSECCSNLCFHSGYKHGNFCYGG